MSINVHIFPLPYHTPSWPQAGHVVLDQENVMFEPADFFSAMFNQQQQFWNPITMNQTGAQALANLEGVLVAGGFASAEVLAAGMADDSINEETRVSWKYACSLGVLGTPTFYVNGVNVNGQPTWQLADWRQIMDPLLAPKPSIASRKAAAIQHQQKAKCADRTMFERKFTIGVGDCPAGEPPCQYLPEKTECCLPGEQCIPNVGCRC